MTPTKSFMSSHVQVVLAQDSMVKAYQLMHEKNIRHLPVVDDRNKVVGILSDRDVQRAMNVKKMNSFQSEISLDGGLVVEDFMSWPVYAVSESTSIKKVAEEMLSQKVSAFIVEDSIGHMKGIITTDDLLKYLLREENIQDHIITKNIRHYFQHPEVL